MREKKQWLIVTFYTTSAAMAAEKACEQTGLPGRIIPVPREITADCGLGWRTPPETRPQVEAHFTTHELEVEGYHQCELRPKNAQSKPSP